MSLILEALRKSEAERRAAELPGLITAPPAREAQRRTPIGPWLTLLAGVLAAGLALGWLGTRWMQPHLADDRLQAPAAAVEPSSPPTPANPRAAQLAQQAVPMRQEPAPAPPSLPQKEPVAALPAPAPTGIDLPSPAIPPTLPPPQTQPADSAPVAAPIPDAVPLGQMPSAQRSRLPPLRLTVHVFNDEPERRFAIVDGRRVVEGDALGAGVLVRSIRRDGLLLDVDQQPWLLERPR